MYEPSPMDLNNVTPFPQPIETNESKEVYIPTEEEQELIDFYK